MRVELLGIARERAGVAELEVEVDTLGDLLATISTKYPAFAELVTAEGLQSAVVANLNGDRFISDPRTPLHKGDSVLLLSNDAGG